MRDVEIDDEIARQHERDGREQRRKRAQELAGEEKHQDAAEQQAADDEQVVGPWRHVERQQCRRWEKWLRDRICEERRSVCVVGIPKRYVQFIPELIGEKLVPSLVLPSRGARVRRALKTNG